MKGGGGVGGILRCFLKKDLGMNLVNSVGNGVARVQFDGGEGGFTGSWG